MEQPHTEEIPVLAFMRLCLNEAVRTSPEKADWIVLIIGAFLGPIALLAPQWETRVTHLLLMAPISALSSVVIFRIFLSPLIVYRKRETEARKAEVTLHRIIAERDETILKLTPKPRTAAQQHDYDLVKTALNLLSDKGKIALRFLRQRTTLTYGFPVQSSTIPPGINVNEAMWVYNHCATEGVISCEEKPGSGVKTFSIPPNMAAILDELLYEDETR